MQETKFQEKISIIVPVYNLQLYIKRTIDSILAQTYKNIEIIVVDDGSKDNSWIEIQKIAATDNRIIPIHQANGGVTSARFNGIIHATGQWIGFVDGDDEIEPDMYEMLLNNALRHNADISHCGYQMIFDDGRIHYFHNTGCIVQQDCIEGVKDLLEGTLIEPGLWNKLYKKKLFDKLLHDELIPLQIKINEDLLMNFHLFLQSRVAVFEDVCKYHYLVRQASASRQKPNEHKIYDPIRVKALILAYADERFNEEAQRAYIRTCIYTYCNLKGKEYQTDRKKVRENILAHKEWVRLLPTRIKILGNLIVTAPRIFQAIYLLYEKFLQSKKYD